MGTRNLTAVMVNGEYKLAQYGQWDGYPEGQGLTALIFCLKYLQTEEGVARFKEKLNLVHFCSEEEVKKCYEDVSLGSKQWLSLEEAKKFNKKYPYFSCDHGADILEYVMVAPEKQPFLAKEGSSSRWELREIPLDGYILTTNQIGFANESLFCEWAYVIDFDKMTFEVYKGFNKNPVPVDQRFGSEKPLPTEYQPVSLVTQWRLNELPSSEEAFLFDLENQ